MSAISLDPHDDETPLVEKEISYRTWNLNDIPFHDVAREAVRNNPLLFSLLAGASFTEITSAVYADMLARHYDDYPELARWVKDRWQHEEIQHGEALKRYVHTVWPEFDWEQAYAGFFPEYTALCSVDQLDPDQGLEMLARSVIEVGTSVFYATISQSAPDPVLRQLADRIRKDEVRHYNYFLSAFRKYARDNGYTRYRIARTILSRLAEADSEDAAIAIRNVDAGLAPGHPFKGFPFQELERRFRALARGHLPYSMAVSMLLRPLALPALAKKPLTPLLTRTARTVLFR